MNTKADLIARLEAATEGSRELDADILALSDYRSTMAYRSWVMMQPRGTAPDARAYLLRFAPYYTSSMDAAIKLVPDGYAWTLYSDGSCSMGREPERGCLMDAEFNGDGATPALGLTAAALKSRTSTP